MANSQRANGPELPLEQYRMLVECSKDVATITKPDGEITYVSPSVRRVLGYEPGELIGEIGYDYQHPSDRERTAEAFEALEADPETPQVVETRFRRADGSWCSIEATIREYPGADDDQRILISSRDVTDRKRRDEEMQTLAREYRALLENVQDAIFLIDVEPLYRAVRADYLSGRTSDAGRNDRLADEIRPGGRRRRSQPDHRHHTRHHRTQRSGTAT